MADLATPAAPAAPVPFLPAGAEGEEERLRPILTRRLVELVGWPETRISRHERELAADVLIGLLRRSSEGVRRLCAERLAPIQAAPKGLLRFLSRDAIEVATPLLESSEAYDDADLVSIVRSTQEPHWRLIARRKVVSEVVSDALIETGHAAIVLALLHNRDARFSVNGLDALVRQARDEPQIASLLARREELTPAHGLTLFWWSDPESRLHLLRRFAVERATLIHELGDLFAAATGHDYTDAEARTVMQFIERRQRSRAAAQRSRHGSLEGAIEAACEEGMSRDLLVEICQLAGLRVGPGLRMLADRGGEPAAVICKACGVKRGHFEMLWRALGRDSAPTDPTFERAALVYESMAVARAQTALRYWNWALTSDKGLEVVDPTSHAHAAAERFAAFMAAPG